MTADAQQVRGPGPARYELVGIEIPADPAVCRFCGGDIVKVKGEWWAISARWPNLKHCHYSAQNGEGMPHLAEGKDR